MLCKGRHEDSQAGHLLEISEFFVAGSQARRGQKRGERPALAQPRNPPAILCGGILFIEAMQVEKR